MKTEDGNTTHDVEVFLSKDKQFDAGMYRSGKVRAEIRTPYGVNEYMHFLENPPDAQPFQTSLKAHRRQYGKAPREVSGDRGVYSPENEQAARQAGVRRVCLPKPGHKTAPRQRREKQRWFRAAQRFRNGIEGRISHVRRARGLTRCLNHGLSGFERWIGWGIIANNIAVIVMNLNKRHLSLTEALA